MEFYASHDHQDFRRLIEFGNQAYFGDVSWDIRSDPSTATINDEDLTTFQLTKVHNTDFETAYLLVPLSRHYEVMDVIPIGRELTLKAVLTRIHKFYHETLSTKQIEKIKFYPRCGYKDELIDRANEGENVSYVDLRGDCVCFEGIKRVRGNIYEMILGS